ncbi:hypothetical protein TWF281_002359 [Arthrobotrys megalospora]
MISQRCVSSCFNSTPSYVLQVLLVAITTTISYLPSVPKKSTDYYTMANIQNMFGIEPSPLYTISADTGEVVPIKAAILNLSDAPIYGAPAGVKVTEDDPMFPAVAVARAKITRTVFQKLVSALETEKTDKLAILHHESERQGTVFHPLLSRGPGTLGVYASAMAKSTRLENIIQSIEQLDACTQALTRAMAETVVMNIRQAGTNTKTEHLCAIIAQITKTVEELDMECGTGIWAEIEKVVPPCGILIPMEPAGREEEEGA